MQNLQTTLETILIEELLSQDLFPVEINTSGEGKMKVKVSLGGDNGVTIDECAIVSRKLGAIIEEQELIDIPYVLEVSSAGVGEPLRLKRQYANNIDRFLEIQLRDEAKMITGKLVAVEENSIQLLPEIQKKTKNKAQKMKLADQPTEILFEQIERAVVMVIF